MSHRVGSRGRIGTAIWDWFRTRSVGTSASRTNEQRSRPHALMEHSTNGCNGYHRTDRDRLESNSTLLHARFRVPTVDQYHMMAPLGFSQRKTDRQRHPQSSLLCSLDMRCPLALFFSFLIVLALLEVTVSGSVTYSEAKVTSNSTLRMRIGTTTSSNIWIQQAAVSYGTFRPEIRLDVFTSLTVGSVNAPRVALAQLQRGDTDVAFLPMTPTPAELQQSPDLLFLPFWATAFTIVYNLPTSEVGSELILSLPVLGRIYLGNITRSKEDMPCSTCATTVEEVRKDACSCLC